MRVLKCCPLRSGQRMGVRRVRRRRSRQCRWACVHLALLEEKLLLLLKLFENLAVLKLLPGGRWLKSHLVLFSV